LMSASVLSFDPQIAFDAGCDDFLPKPFRQDDLLDRLARTLKLTWARLPENQNSEIDAPLPNQAIPTPPEKRSDLLAELRHAADRGDIRRIRALLPAIQDAALFDAATVAQLQQAVS